MAAVSFALVVVAGQCAALLLAGHLPDPDDRELVAASFFAAGVAVMAFGPARRTGAALTSRWVLGVRRPPEDAARVMTERASEGVPLEELLLQLAESLRNREERPLSILTIDIRDFGAVNSMLGHSVGDRMLEFVGARIGEHLRKMDFLARTVNDEFIVILPTAPENIALEIIERVKEHFARNEFEIADGEGVAVALNIGWASLWHDGETAEQLLRAAQQRKREAKSEAPAGVLWFPREYVN